MGRLFRAPIRKRLSGSPGDPVNRQNSKLNCEVLWDQLAFEVRWAVAGDSIVLQLVSKLENEEYMAFGLSGDDRSSQMVGGDVTVAWVDKDTLKGHAFDYYLDAKSQCSGGRGSCPDEKIIERSNSIRLLNAALVNGYSIVTYQRSLRPQDELDQQIFTNGSQPVIWAIGPLNSLNEVSYHSLANRGNVFIDFGRSPKWNCPTPESSTPQTDAPESSSNNFGIQPVQYVKQHRVPTDNAQQTANRQETQSRVQVPTPAPVPKTNNAWDIPAIQCHEPEDGVFYAQMGPTGGKRGYSAITGHVGWGISWYINGLLIPEINVVRGRTYTFIVEGGLDPEIPARYHPFYITDDPVGGYEHKTPEERAHIQIFAGAVQNKRGEVRPTGVGRLCNWTPDPKQPPADEFASFGAYQRTLRLECDQGEPGIIQWTVDRDTPDTVYYQCYTHRYLGWKINVLDHCDTEGAGSDPVPSVVKAPADIYEKYSHDFGDEAQESVIHLTKIKPEFGLKNEGEKFASENSTRVIANEFVRYQPQITYVPEFTFYNEDTGEPLSAGAVEQLKSQEEIARLKTQYALKDPLLKQQATQQTQETFYNHRPQGLHIRPDSPQTVGRHPTSQQKVVSLDLTSTRNEEIINFYRKKKPDNQKNLQGPPQRHQDYEFKVILSKDPNQIHEKNVIRNSNFYVKPDSQDKSSFQIGSVKFPGLKNEQSDEEFLKNYQILRVQAEENSKKHQQKLQIYNKPSNRLPNGQIIGGQNRLQFGNSRKPQHAITLQQRPLPPGMFRPPFLPPPGNVQKRPTALTLHTVPSFLEAGATSHRLSAIPAIPQKLVLKQEPAKSPQIDLQQFLTLQKLSESRGSLYDTEINASALLKAFPVVEDNQKENVQLAVNTGFNPDSVKVEGGFKPILNTGIVPKFELLKRADKNMAAEADEKVGVIDLRSGGDLEEKDAMLKDEKEEIINAEMEGKKTSEDPDKASEELDLFKNQKPQMFEPIFIPSPPDDRMHKHQEKHKKKPITKNNDSSMKYRSSQLQYYNTNKNGNHIKIRPRPNLIRRPLYPDNVVPPFRIQVRGGAPQYRYQQPDELENTTDFDIIQMNNNTDTSDENTAENILEIIKMEEIKSKENGTTEELEDQADKKASSESSTEDELAMANSRKDYYIPPKEDQVLTYDGKVVKAEPAPTLPHTKNADISKLPQFGPFRGETPPLTPASNKNKQVTVTRTANQDILPPSSQSTKLTSVAHHNLYEPQTSDIEETILREIEIQNEPEVRKIKHEGKFFREKRSPDHIPGHHHDHDHNDHHHHHPPESSSSACSFLHFLPLSLVFSIPRFF